MPHTGPKAFAAVEQNKARKQSTTTLQTGHSKPMGVQNGKTFLADRYVQHPGDPNSTVPTPEIQNALNTVKGVLADLSYE